MTAAVSSITTTTNNNNNTITRSNHPYALCISTTKPPPTHQSTTSSTSNDAILFICPYTGTILSNSNPAYTLRPSGGGGGGGGGGVLNLCRFSSATSGLKSGGLYLAFVDGKRGAGGGGNDSTGAGGYAALLQLGSSTPKWKCTLPERPTFTTSSSTTLLLHPNNRYVLAGCPSGTLYLWNIIHNGALVTKFTAHHRPITSLCITSCGEYVLTGGEDGIVNMWSFLDILSFSSTGEEEHNAMVRPIHTWSAHSLPITHLSILSSTRIISTSMDRLVVIMELTSGKTLATIAMPVGITCLVTPASCFDYNEYDDLSVLSKRIYAGGVNGCIYVIDLDVYGIKRSAESATVIFDSGVQRKQQQQQQGVSGGTMSKEGILGLGSTTTASSSSSSTPHVMELRGHEGPITSLAILNHGTTASSATNVDNYNQEGLIVSGGQDGSVRVWSIASRCCIRTIRPWSGPASATTSSTAAAAAATTSSSSPCNSILVLSRPALEETICGTGIGRQNIFTNNNTTTSNHKSKRKQMDGSANLSSLFHPLRRFESTGSGSLATSSSGSGNVPMAMMNDGGNDRNHSKRKKMNLVEEHGWTVPLMKMARDESSIDFWEGRDSYSPQQQQQQQQQQQRKNIGERGTIHNLKPLSTKEEEKEKEDNEDKNEDEKKSGNNNNDKEDEEESELQRLKRELNEAQETIQRWEQVNHKLVAKLNKSKKKSK